MAKAQVKKVRAWKALLLHGGHLLSGPPASTPPWDKSIPSLHLETQFPPRCMLTESTQSQSWQGRTIRSHDLNFKMSDTWWKWLEPSQWGHLKRLWIAVSCPLQACLSALPSCNVLSYILFMKVFTGRKELVHKLQFTATKESLQMKNLKESKSNFHNITPLHFASKPISLNKLK